jgi:hypothetical protein
MTPPGAKSIPRCSISLAPDSSPNPSRTRLPTCSWLGFCRAPGRGATGFGPCRSAALEVSTRSGGGTVPILSGRRHGEVNSPLRQHVPGSSPALQVFAALPAAPARRHTQRRAERRSASAQRCWALRSSVAQKRFTTETRRSRRRSLRLARAKIMVPCLVQGRHFSACSPGPL